MIIAIVSFIVVFTIVALAHELGHLLFSKHAGIRVIEFGLGFGPRLISFDRGGTLYCLNLIPILGYVKIAGLDDEEKADSSGRLPSDSYLSKTPWQKFLSLFGGPFFNLLLASLILYFLFTFFGMPSGISNEIAVISPGSEAQRVGFMSGDRIVALNGVGGLKMEDVIDRIHKSPDRQLTLTIDRGGKVIKIKATPRLQKKLGIGLIGFSLKPIYVRTDPISAVYQSVVQVFVTSVAILYTVGLLLIGKVSILDLAGPVGIAHVTGQVAEEGLAPLMSFTAFLSINLGLLNLVPLPALDGGRIFFVLLEKLMGRPVDRKLENNIHEVGFVLLLVLMAVVSVNDILKIFGK